MEFHSDVEKEHCVACAMLQILKSCLNDIRELSASKGNRKAVKILRELAEAHKANFDVYITSLPFHTRAYLHIRLQPEKKQVLTDYEQLVGYKFESWWSVLFKASKQLVNNKLAKWRAKK